MKKMTKKQHEQALSDYYDLSVEMDRQEEEKRHEEDAPQVVNGTSFVKAFSLPVRGEFQDAYDDAAVFVRVKQ